MVEESLPVTRKPPTPEEQLKRRDKWLRNTYGISLEECNDILKEQGGKCAICSVDISGKGQSNVDHCHTTRTVRGILCPNCNKGLGQFGDNINALEAASEYLRKHSARPSIVKMPVYSPPTKPPKKGVDHGNTGAVRSTDTRALIAAARRKAAAEKYEAEFNAKVCWWKSNPTGDEEKKWRHSVSRKYRDKKLPQSCIDMLISTTGWTFSQGTPHTTDSRIQPRNLTPAPAAPPDTP